MPAPTATATLFRAQFAPIANPEIMYQLAEDGLTGSHQFVLVHEIANKLDGYARALNMAARMVFPQSMRIIIDNGVIEKGVPWEMDDILDVARKLRDRLEYSHAIYIPHRDWLRKKHITLDACDEDIPKILESGFSPLLIPQGRSPQDVEICANAILSKMREVEIGQVHGMWGIPRWMADDFGTRSLICDIVQRIDRIRLIHLLGFSSNILDDMACCHLPGIVGIDSAVPIWWGMHENSMLCLGLPGKEDHRPDDFFTWQYLPTASRANCLWVWKMISGGAWTPAGLR